MLIGKCSICKCDGVPLGIDDRCDICTEHGENNNIVRECDHCGKEDSVSSITGLCPSCQIKPAVKVYNQDGELKNFIEKGHCPFCDSKDLNRIIDCFGDNPNVINVATFCKNCKTDFTEFFELNEILARD